MSAPSREEAVRAKALLDDLAWDTMLAEEAGADARGTHVARVAAITRHLASEYARGVAEGREQEREALLDHFAEVAVDAVKRWSELNKARALSGAAKEGDDDALGETP